ncbi:MAG: DNA mismatch repair protein MutS [Alkalispirochaeta sp.]
MSTPMFQQYEEIKSRHRDAILLFRLGDFYEMFGADARDASRILGLTLTHRQHKAMCGVPHHAARGYIGRLLKAGKKVAICEQVGTPDGKTLTRRDVVEVLSPGAVFDSDYLQANRNNYLVAIGSILRRGTRFLSIASCDASIGEVTLAAYVVSTDDGPGDPLDAILRREIERLDPGELLVQESLFEESELLSRFSDQRPGAVVNRIPDWGFDIAEAYRRLTETLEVRNLQGFGFDDDDPALLPAATLLEYLRENAHHRLYHLREVKRYRPGDTLVLDDATVRNLELVRNLRDGGESFTLLSVLDTTTTPMGSRRLRRWLLQPLRDPSAIRRRLDGVDQLYHHQQELQAVRRRLSDAYDLERLVGRLGIEKAHPKDLLAISATLKVALAVQDAVPQGFTIASITETGEERELVESVVSRIEQAIAEDAPIVLHEGGIFRSGFDEELDRVRSLRDNGRSVLENYLEEQRTVTGISSLKIRYNRMLGHFFEVPRSQAARIPETFIRRQSLASAERYTTPRLSEIESEINNAEATAIERERELYVQLRSDLIATIPLLRTVADRLAEIDTLASLAQVATLRGYRRPTLVEEARMSIQGGRHPVVEAHMPSGDFVANDLELGSEHPRFALVTGPNMAGKSTVLRQTALITLLAHIGSFVPAEEATIGLCDRIFCRVGASDNIARGESTFLVEMNETSNILRNATGESLVIMDEVGRGTSTHDGLSIAWAVCEHLLERNGSRTLFATHFHELAQIDHPDFVTLSMAVEHSADRIIFLKRLVPGGEDHSYGVDVARLAGLPESVIERARRLLAFYEAHGTGGTPGEAPVYGETAPVLPKAPRQDTLFSPEELLLDEIRGIDPDALSPREALDLIYRWINALKG